LKAGKDQAVAWNELGNLYRGLNDYDNALAAYQKADELDPDHVDVNDSAEYLYSESNEGSAHVLTELGELLFKSGSYHEASNCFRKTIERDPLNAQAYINLALCLMYQSKFEDAVPLYVKSIGLLHDDKDKAEAWNQLGNVYRRLNDYENAVDAYQNAVELSNDRETLVARARFSLLGNCYTD
jgi:tetratricopeptide (TPR) repeat protein